MLGTSPVGTLPILSPLLSLLMATLEFLAMNQTGSENLALTICRKNIMVHDKDSDVKMQSPAFCWGLWPQSEQ